MTCRDSMTGLTQGRVEVCDVRWTGHKRSGNEELVSGRTGSVKTVGEWKRKGTGQA